MVKIGEKIFKLRKALGFSQEDLADKVGVSRQTIYRWESDTVQPDADNMKLLCEALSVSKSYFYDEIAITNADEDAVKVKNARKRKILIISIVLSSIFLIVLLFLSVLVGTSVFTSNTGDMIERTSNLERNIFIILIICLCIVAITQIVLVILLIKAKKQSK